MKKIALALAAVLALAGCEGTNSTPPDPAPTLPVDREMGGVYWQELPDGNAVLCVYMASPNGNGGLSCNWEDVKETS